MMREWCRCSWFCGVGCVLSRDVLCVGSGMFGMKLCGSVLCMLECLVCVGGYGQGGMRS